MTNLTMRSDTADANPASAQLVTMIVAEQLFGIAVLEVRDILGPQRAARVPLAPPEIVGSLNLRGRIVTVMDMRARLDLPSLPQDARSMSVVVEHKGELYSLIVDKVGEVVGLPRADYEQNPPTLDSRWHEVSDGIYRLKETLLVVLSVPRLLRLEEKAVA